MNIIASLFNLAGPDLLVILLIVLLLFGAKKLPELARGMGQAVREFSKAKDEFEHELTRPVTTEVVVQPAPGALEHKASEPVATAQAAETIAPAQTAVATAPAPATTVINGSENHPS